MDTTTFTVAFGTLDKREIGSIGLYISRKEAWEKAYAIMQYSLPHYLLAWVREY